MRTIFYIILNFTKNKDLKAFCDCHINKSISPNEISIEGFVEFSSMNCVDRGKK